MQLLVTGAPLTSLGARALTSGFLIIMMFSLGLELGGQPPEEKSVKRHRRLLLLRALAINLVLLPMITWALVGAFHGTGAIGTAVLLLAATPGGRFAPRVAKLARADLGLAVEVTLFLAKLTGFTAPLTVKWLLGVPSVELRDLQLIGQLLVLQMLPYLAGRWVRRARPALAAPLARPLRIAEAMIAAAFVLFLVARGELADLREFSATGVAAAAAFAAVTLGVGWLSGGGSPESRRALAVTATARNLALALVIAGEKFSGGAVQLALFSIWFLCLAFELAFAAVVRGVKE